MRAARLAVAAAMAWWLAGGAPVEASCTISTTGVSYGTYDVFSSSAVDSTGTVTYNCLLVTSVQITMSKGSAPTFSPRQMPNGAEVLTYNLYLDASRTTIWGDGTGGTSVYSQTLPPLGTNVNVTVYGRVPAGQDVSAGTYSDNVTATINF